MEKKAAGGATAVRLDGAQREAVECPAARLLVAAGPGSGKTAVLAARCARLAARGDGGGILALTFTNRAALEMRRRVGAVLDELGKERRPAGQCRVTTFHAFALEVVKAEGLASRLLGRQAQLALLSELGAETPAAALERISAAKGRRGRSAPPLPPLSGGDDDPLLRAYEKARRALDAVDLDDLVPAAVDLFASRPEVLAAYRARFRHVMVDEFQDIDPLQAALLELLAGPENTLFAIGDPDQAIYGFRGANLEGFLDFENRHDGARVLTLDANYRSSASIVGASASLIRHNRVRLERELRAVREPGEPVRAVECADERAEARFIAGEIERLMGGLASLTTGRAEQSGG
ncbi:MAG TPA: ATP-dependent helicase, partial [Deltaproteobacteria bacterium]|nr:ATP-dependent helicase [Deltaproteobacteria bacterium]